MRFALMVVVVAVVVVVALVGMGAKSAAAAELGLNVVGDDGTMARTMTRTRTREEEADAVVEAMLGQLTKEQRQKLAVAVARLGDREKPESSSSGGGLAHHSGQACWRSGKLRGKPTLPDHETHKCPKGTSNEAGFCYPDCDSPTYEPLGSMCWETCRGNFPATGLVFCCRSEDACSDLLNDLAYELPESLIKFIFDLVTNATDITRIFHDYEALLKSVLKLVLPACNGDFDSVVRSPQQSL